MPMTGRDIREGGKSEIESFLEELRLAPKPTGSPSGQGRLIFALDATASRERTWDQACEVQGQMFLEADRLGGLTVQLVYYRGFHECKASGWLKSTAELVRLMTRVACRAGQTQLRRVLRHAIKEASAAPVQALVFIGDCMEEQLDELAELGGQLGLLGVRCFMFQEGRDPPAERAFREIARLSRGAYCRFDRNAPGELRALLGAVAAFAAGGTKALQQLGDRGSSAVKLLTRQVS